MFAGLNSETPDQHARVGEQVVQDDPARGPITGY
jgi:hypothetical protein